MRTINFQTLGISPTSKFHVHGHLSSTNNLNPSFIWPQPGLLLTIKSLKMVEQGPKSAYSPIQVKNHPTMACFVSNSDSRAQIVAASDLDNNISRMPEIGVGVFILKDDKVLLGRRLSSIGAYMYALPGGHLEYGESFKECAAREVKEETGLDIKDIEVLMTTNHQISKAVHAVGIYVRAHLADPNQTPQNLEPNKCEGWDWYDLQNLPQPLFGPIRQVLQAGLNPFPVES